MTGLFKKLMSAFVVLTVLCCASAANALCTINPGLTVTTLSFNTGTYTPPATPASQLLAMTVSGTYSSNNSAVQPTCTLALSFNRASLPASMARTGGGGAMPYTIQSAPGGGNTLLFTGGGTPTASQYASASFNQAGTNLTNVSFSVVINLYFLIQPTSPQEQGSYTDNPTLRAYNVRQGTGALTLLGSGAFTVSGAVAKACTINNVSTPGADTATIPIGTTGTVTTSPISRSYLTVQCNGLSNLQATSQSGAVKRAVAAPSGLTNLINYSATATFGGATSTINTATVATATGAEAGSVGVTSTSTPTGTLAVTITPQSTVLPLAKGNYTDTLRVTITPQ